jgi:hypothetical protein
MKAVSSGGSTPLSFLSPLAPAGPPRHTRGMGQEHDDYADPPISRRHRRLFWATILLIILACWILGDWAVRHFNLLPVP